VRRKVDSDLRGYGKKDDLKEKFLRLTSGNGLNRGLGEKGKAIGVRATAKLALYHSGLRLADQGEKNGSLKA